MSKGITPEGETYTFHLSNELKELSEQELRETSNIRDHSLKSLREWIATNPRITSIRLGI